MIFVGTYTQPTDSSPDSKGKGIHIYNVNWDLIDIIKCDNPSYLITTKDKLICTNELKIGFVSIYNMVDKYDLIKTRISNGAYPCHLSLFNNKIVVCNYGNNISVINGNINGKTVIIKGSHPHCSVPVPNSNNIIISDLGNDTLTIYNNHLELIMEIKLKIKTGPRHITFHPKSHYCYVSNELSGGITIINTCTWTVANITEGGTRPSHLMIWNDYLYIAYRNENTIATYHIEDDKLILKQTIDCGGKNPRHFDMNPSGKVLAVANQDTNNISLFHILPDGLLVYNRSIDVGTPVYVLFCS